MERTFRETSLGNISYLKREGTDNLIFLHGIGGSSNNWMKLVNHLDERFSLIFLDLLGHGKTQTGSWDYSIDGQCRMLAEFIESTGIENYGLVGNSYGGWISAAFAARYGNPQYLILEDSAGLNPTMAEGGTEQLESFIDRLQKFGRDNDREMMRSIMLHNATRKERLGDSDMGAISSRTLVVWGENDRIIDIEYGRKLAQGIGESRFEVIPGAGHVPHYSNPVELSALLNEFVLSEAV